MESGEKERNFNTPLGTLLNRSQIVSSALYATYSMLTNSLLTVYRCNNNNIDAKVKLAQLLAKYMNRQTYNIDSFLKQMEYKRCVRGDAISGIYVILSLFYV